MTTATDALGVRDWGLWSTTARLVVTDPARLAEAADLVDDLLAAVDRAASRFRPDSELLGLARSGDGDVVLSPLLAALLAEALDAARETGGAVDPTLGGALVALGYDRDFSLLARPGTTPDGAAGARGSGAPVVVRSVPGWHSLALTGRRLSMPAGVQLDLGATAKAGAADRAAAVVSERLGTGVLVSLGGDVATAGPPPAGGWQVTVQDLPVDVPQQVTLAAGAALATSSTVRRTWRTGDRDVHHLLDPRTGQPARGPWRTASVVAPSCTRANAASTAALVKGGDAVTWLRGTGLPARLVSEDGDVVVLGGWPAPAVPEGRAS